MSATSVQNNQQAVQAEAVSNEQAAHKRGNQQSAIPEDKGLSVRRRRPNKPRRLSVPMVASNLKTGA
jgi:hypothetical protein